MRSTWAMLVSCGLTIPRRLRRSSSTRAILRVTAVAVSDAERDPDRERIVVDCFLGSNWVLTAHTADIAALDDFRQVAEGQGEIGLLDAPSFLSTVLEWVVTSYLHAFDEIEESLDEFDVKALANPSKDPGGGDAGAQRRSQPSRPPAPDARTSPRGVRGAQPLRVRPALVAGVGRAVPRAHRDGSTPRSPPHATPGTASQARSTS